MYLEEAVKRERKWVVARLVRHPERIVTVALELGSALRHLNAGEEVQFADRPFTKEDGDEVLGRLREAAYWLDSDVGDRVVEEDSGQWILFPRAWSAYSGKERLMRGVNRRRPHVDGWGHTVLTDGSLPTGQPRPPVTRPR